MGKRTSTAAWLEKQNRWQIKVQKDNERRTFSSSKPGRTGQREANAKADAWLDDNIKNNITVNELQTFWLNEIKATTGTSNYRNNSTYFRIWVVPSIGRKKLADLSEQSLQNILNAAFTAGLSMKTIKNIRGSINQFFKYARKCNATKLLPENLKIPSSAPQGEKRILSQSEFKKLFTASIDTIYVYAFQLLAATGLRRGELLAIKPMRDIIDGNLYVRESINAYQEVTKGKTKNAVRVLSLNETCRTIINAQLELLNTKGIKTHYLFPDTYGDMQNANSFYQRWCAFCTANGIQKISLHELRHTFISMCKQVPIELLRGYVGHSATMDTFGQYGHELDGEKQETAALIESQLRKYIR